MKSLSREQLQRMLDEQGSEVHLINVLDEQSFAQEHIPGSHNVPLDDSEFEQRVLQLVHDRAEPVVLYCASFACEASTRAARKLEQLGFTQVYDYKGGMQDWKQAHLPVHSGMAGAQSFDPGI